MLGHSSDRYRPKLCPHGALSSVGSREIQITNLGSTKREEDEEQRLKNRKTRHGPDIWEGFLKEVIFGLRTEECRGDC